MVDHVKFIQAQLPGITKAWIIDNSIHQKIQELGLCLSEINPILTKIPQYQIVLTDNRLSLYHKIDKHCVFVDFNSRKFQYRSNAHLNAELVIKAVMGRNKAPKTIIDATVGFGADSYLLSLTGSKIIAFESNPLMYLMLKDGIQRAQIDNIDLNFQNSLKAISVTECDAIYIDPMYPESNKSAKTNKYMAFLQACVGHQAKMAEELFLTSTKSIAKKIIVKRPIKSNYVLNRKPTSQIIGKTARFDIYAQ